MAYDSEPPGVSPAQADALCRDGWTLLDVRTDAEWAAGRIDGAVHLPMDQVVARLDEIGERVVCVCAVGGRSARVTAYLVGQGRDAVNLEGGLQAWAADGLPVATD